MTVRVLGLESGVTSLEDHRQLLQLFLPPTGAGILERKPGLAPSSGAADLTTASAMQANVAAFVAWIDGTSSALQGGYPFVSDAAVTLTFSDGDATNDRIDRVVAQIRDNTYDASGETDGRVVVVEGTPAGSPSPPALPESSIPLYQVLVGAGSSAGSGGIDFGTNTTDEREYLEYLAALAASADLPDSDGVELSNDSPSTGGSFHQWGTEEITFPNPGVAVKVMAWGAGEARNTTEDVSAGMRLEISLDGGSSWDEGRRPRGNLGAATQNQRENLAAVHHVSGTPTGSVMVRAQMWATSSTTTFQEGSILATIMRAV